ncbi:MAG TPA: MOSC domain-containing protein [Prosthecobacter sp.]|nr:MOSC domain-containing protein [Prosthecobacter sp.]
MSATPILEALFITPAASQPMRRVGEVRAIAGQGLEGDRYALGIGYYSGRYDCQVTLIEAEVLDQIEAENGPAMRNGQHRRNLVTRGLRLRDLEGCRLRIGEVLLEWERPRPPCDYVQRLTEPGMTKALGKGAGIGMRVVAGGVLREGMGIEVVRWEAARRVLP